MTKASLYGADHLLVLRQTLANLAREEALFLFWSVISCTFQRTPQQQHTAYSSGAPSTPTGRTHGLRALNFCLGRWEEVGSSSGCQSADRIGEKPQ